MLQQHRPVLLSELHAPQLERAGGVTAYQFLQQMRALGYRAHHVHGSGGPAETGHYVNVGAVIERPPDEPIVSVVFVPAT
jgi:hypothetical protein